ncbi:hypothetical protein QE152_g10231 [Popillia japonica]|uniref:Uncharacterized protein n=1 Tax=Popillia japonica TaxID=7064 RepID=A0AAW1LX19_POPJA
MRYKLGPYFFENAAAISGVPHSKVGRRDVALIHSSKYFKSKGGAYYVYTYIGRGIRRRYEEERTWKE